MKTIKRVVTTLSLMLLFCGTCFSQEEFRKDSVWGLEWNLQDSVLTVSFLSSCGETNEWFQIQVRSFHGGVYMRRNTYDMASYYIDYREGSREYGIPDFDTSNPKSFSFVSFSIDTLAPELKRYTLSIALAEEYFDIPEDLSTYVGYFGVLFHNQNHPHEVYYDYETDYTQYSHFMYFDLLGELSCRVDTKNDAEPYRKVYYSLSGKPLQGMKENEPMVVVSKNDKDQIISSEITIWRP